MNVLCLTYPEHAEPESTAEGAAEPEGTSEPGSGGKQKKGKNISSHSHKNHHDDGAHAEPESAAAEPEADARACNNMRFYAFSKSLMSVLMFDTYLPFYLIARYFRT